MRSAIFASLSIMALGAGCYQSHELGRDAGPLPDTGPPIDTGVGARCDDESIPAYAGPPCSDSVNACRHACADDACRDACLDPTCRACFFGTLFRCANAAGCEPLWGTFACCTESMPMCASLRGFDRVMCAPSCPMQFDPFAHCIETMGGMPCFMEASMTCQLR